MFIARNTDENGINLEEITKELADRIDKAVSNDFMVLPLTDQDKNNKFYIALKGALEAAFQTKPLYERKVISTYVILPKVQFLLGFKPRDGMCLIMNKPMHKIVACSEDLAILNDHCFLVNKLQFLLQEVDNDKTWCYIPKCPCDQACELTEKAKELRIKLWTGKPTA